MRSSWSAAVFVVLIGLSVVGVLTVSTRVPGMGGQGAGQALMQLSDATASGYEGGALVWRFSARTIETAKSSRTTTIIGISSGTVFDSDGKAFSVEATRAEYDSRSKMLDVTGGVRLQFPDASRIECAQVAWDVGSRVVRSPGGIVLSLASGGRLSGRNLVVDLAAEEIRMDDVKATLRLRSPQGEGGHGA
jgi:hypothetical protein